MELIIAVYMVEQVFLVFALDKFMKVFFEERNTSFSIYVLTYLVYLAGTVSVFCLLNIPLVNLVCNITTIFLITLNFKSSLKRKITAVCIIYVFMFITDVFLACLTGFIFRSPVDEGECDAIFGYVALGLLFYLEAIFAQNFKNIRKNNPVSGLYWFSSAAIPLLSIFIAISVLKAGNTSHVAQVVFIAALFLINVLIFYLYDSLSAAYADRLKSQLYEKEKEYYYSQCELMRESMEDLRAFRHDIKNNLSVLDSYIIKNQCKEAGEYLHGLIGEVSAVADYSDTGNTAFDSIINYKLRKAAENNAEIKVDVSVPRELKTDAAIVVILGNILDNAVDAVMKTDAGRICLDIEYRKGRLFIYLENTFDGRINSKNGELLTTKSGSGHGYGLKNVCKAIEKYNGCMDIAYNGDVFSVDILLYVIAERFVTVQPSG